MATDKEQVEEFLGIVKTSLDEYVAGIDFDSLSAAKQLILDAEKNGGRVHVTGIGKPGHVSGYAASLFSSTGTPTYELHGTECVHGSAGQVLPGDVVIAISNSGETAELKATVLAVKNNGCRVIGVTGNAESWLAKESDALLLAHVDEEGGPLNRAPRNSVLAEMFVLQALSDILLADVAQTPAQYVRRHPGGALGKIRDNER